MAKKQALSHNCFSRINVIVTMRPLNSLSHIISTSFTISRPSNIDRKGPNFNSILDLLQKNILRTRVVFPPLFPKIRGREGRPANSSPVGKEDLLWLSIIRTLSQISSHYHPSPRKFAKWESTVLSIPHIIPHKGRSRRTNTRWYALADRCGMWWARGHWT